jgi:hypothetical protein
MRWLCVLALVGCGRLGFDAAGPGDGGAGDAGTGDSGPPPRVTRLPCNTLVFLDDGGQLQQDGLAWVRDGANDWLVAILHVSDPVHPIERFAIEESSTGLSITDAGPIHQTVHSHNLAVAPTASGHVMSFFDDGDSTAYTVRLAPGLTELATYSLGAFLHGDPPLARAGGGGLAVVGVVSGQLTVRGVGDDGVPTTGTTLLGTPAEGPDFPTMVALDDGLAVVWQAADGRCRLATLHADLSVAAGPVDMTFGTCTRPQVAWLPAAQRIMVAADDASTGGVAAAIWTTALVPVTVPSQVAASSSGTQIVGDGDSAWVAWVRTADSAMQYVRIDGNGSRTPGSALGQVDTSLTHHHVLQSVAGYPVALWGDVAMGFSFAASRLCR